VATAMSQNFPPSSPPEDKAKYRQFLIDHGFDPNLNGEDIGREYESKSEAERAQIDGDWNDFLSHQ
jgi:hypothetical protein